MEQDNKKNVRFLFKKNTKFSYKLPKEEKDKNTSNNIQDAWVIDLREEMKDTPDLDGKEE